MKRNEKGFTIIELLVAMAILGLLIAIMIPGIAVVRRGARNTARRASLQAIQATIEDYYGTHRKYPTATANVPDGIVINNSGADAEVDSQFAIGTAVATCTGDPGDTGFVYGYIPSGTATYKLIVCMEPDGDEYVLDNTGN